MDKNRIVIISPSLDTNKNVGGISTLTGFLIKNNIKYKYIHFELGKYDLERRGFPWLLRIIKAWIKWGYMMIKHRDLLVHFNFALDKPSIIRDSPLILFARLLNKRMVIHLHGGEYLESENIPILIKKLLILIFSGKEPKIVLSTVEKEIIKLRFNCNNIMVLPNCIDITDAKSFIRSYSGQKALKLLFIGRIVIRKGIEYIFQALMILKERNIPFKFIMAGTGPDKEVYINKFSELLQTDFEFKGVVSGINKTELLKGCDVFLLPSIYGEGLPISLLECMSYSEVPIVTDNGSMKYVVKNGENGFLVNKESSIEIADVIEKLSNEDDLLQKLGRNASLTVFENFNPKVYVEKLNEIYDKV